MGSKNSASWGKFLSWYHLYKREEVSLNVFDVTVQVGKSVDVDHSILMSQEEDFMELISV